MACPKCGFANSRSSKFCAQCGTPLPQNPLPSSIPIHPAPGTNPPKEYAWLFPETKTSKDLGRTKSGILLLMVGVLASPIPAFQVYAGFALIGGGFFLLLGRHAFNRKHGQFTIASLAIYFSDFIAGLVAGFWVGFSLFLAEQKASSTSDLAQALVSGYQDYLIAVAVVGALGAVALVLFTFALQERLGRLLLFVAYTVGLAVEVAIFLIVSPQLPAAAMQLVASGSPLDAFSILNGEFAYLRLLHLIPGLIYSVAYYLAWRRLAKGQLPLSPLP